MREYTLNRRSTRTYESTRRSSNALNNRVSTTYSSYGSNFSRNRNMVHSHSGHTNPFAMIGSAALLVFALGLIYVNAGTKGTSFDYQIAAMDKEIDNLEAQKEDLAVERARLNSIAANEHSTVAASMPDSGAASTYTE